MRFYLKEGGFILAVSEGFLLTIIWMRNNGKSSTQFYLLGLWGCHSLVCLAGVHTGVHKMLFLTFLVISASFDNGRIVPQIKKAAICGFG